MNFQHLARVLATTPFRSPSGYIPALLALPLLLGSAGDALAESHKLLNLKECQGIAEIKTIQEADAADHQAETDLNAAFPAMRSLIEKCAAYAENPKQTGPEFDALLAQQKDTLIKGHAAEDSTQKAIDLLSKYAPSVERLGGDNCAKDMRGDVQSLKGYQKKMDEMEKKIASCSLNPQSYGRNLDRPDPRACGPFGCKQNPDGTWTKRNINERLK